MRYTQQPIEQLVAKHGRATDAGDCRAANRAHDGLAATYRELRRRGLDAQRALLPLLEHEEPSVQCWAAAHAFELAPAAGERVLGRCERSFPGPTALDAQMTLAEWRAGRSRFP